MQTITQQWQALIKWLTCNRKETTYFVVLPNDDSIYIGATSLYDAQDKIFDILNSREITRQYINYAVKNIRKFNAK